MRFLVAVALWALVIYPAHPGPERVCLTKDGKVRMVKDGKVGEYLEQGWRYCPGGPS